MECCSCGGVDVPLNVLRWCWRSSIVWNIYVYFIPDPFYCSFRMLRTNTMRSYVSIRSTRQSATTLVLIGSATPPTNTESFEDWHLQARNQEGYGWGALVRVTFAPRDVLAGNATNYFNYVGIVEHCCCRLKTIELDIGAKCCFFTLSFFQRLKHNLSKRKSCRTPKGATLILAS